MSHRFERALEQGAWVFALALVLLSAWGAGRGVCQMMTLQREQAARSEQLAQLEGHALTMERSLLGLAHADDPKVRYVGYDPQSLYRTLQEAHRGAGGCIEAIEARTTQGVALETYTALVRLHAVWQRVDAALSDYLQQGQLTPISLTTLRAFSFEGQTSLAEATRAFRRADQREQQAVWERTVWELVGYFVLQMMSMGLIVGLLWRRWGAPAKWLQRALHQPSRAHFYTARLQRTEWGELYERLRFQERRLREAEAFMRDLAMGRTPAPITPTDAADPLARSSQWLLRRLEREHAPHEQAS
ncbi:MAG: hypothetical protein K6U77_10110 [Armatimonadetes bacterium]|nr:hypothetical protein [Armatimonadota bacterium]